MKKTKAPESPDASVAALTGWQRDRVETLRALVREAAALNDTLGDPTQAAKGR